MAVAVRGGSLEKGVFIDAALPSSPWALLGASHLSPPLQTRITASASVPRRPSLQRLLNTVPGRHHMGCGSEAQDGRWAAFGPLQSPRGLSMGLM